MRVARMDDEAGWCFVGGGGFDGGGSDPANGSPHLQDMHRTEKPVLLSRHVT